MSEQLESIHVVKYLVQCWPVLNGVEIERYPVMFEPGDHFHLDYSVQRDGFMPFAEYMEFLNEAFKSKQQNISSNYQGTWRFFY